MFRGDPRRSRVMSCCASAVRLAIRLDSFSLEFPEMRLHFLYQLLYERGAGFLRTDWASFNLLRGCILQWVRLIGGHCDFMHILATPVKHIMAVLLIQKAV